MLTVKAQKLLPAKSFTERRCQHHRDGTCTSARLRPQMDGTAGCRVHSSRVLRRCAPTPSGLFFVPESPRPCQEEEQGGEATGGTWELGKNPAKETASGPVQPVPAQGQGARRWAGGDLTGAEVTVPKGILQGGREALPRNRESLGQAALLRLGTAGRHPPGRVAPEGSRLHPEQG
ncbi:hypothetical protein H920_11488 [Fukomys damarensis]|uniref:Uncharacterized protein n=1 Tax=Fukomys damarensis TaxID=885580 RepID=A0A091D9B3_FUKDA|nr:hypothetical protein H920_11488 [Fukomys damarensis]